MSAAGVHTDSRTHLFDFEKGHKGFDGDNATHVARNIRVDIIETAALCTVD